MLFSYDAPVIKLYQDWRKCY